MKIPPPRSRPILSLLPGIACLILALIPIAYGIAVFANRDWISLDHPVVLALGSNLLLCGLGLAIFGIFIIMRRGHSHSIKERLITCASLIGLCLLAICLIRSIYTHSMSAPEQIARDLGILESATNSSVRTP